MFNIDLLSDRGDGLLVVVDYIRAALCFTLMLVLVALSRHPDVLSFVLVMLAVFRCFGHRSEPADCALPALASISVVTREATRSV